jgi:dienelactone hydrolase
MLTLNTETDQIFPPEKRRQTEDILFTKDVPWQINLFSDVQHGFATRGDLKSERVTWAKEQAFLQAVHWFDRFIKK